MLQNPYGQGYIGSFVLDKLRNGCTVKADAPLEVERADREVHRLRHRLRRCLDRSTPMSTPCSGITKDTHGGLREDLPDLQVTRASSTPSAAERSAAWRLPAVRRLPLSAAECGDASISDLRQMRSGDRPAGTPTSRIRLGSAGRLVRFSQQRVRPRRADRSPSARLRRLAARLHLALQPVRLGRPIGIDIDDRLLDDGGDRHRRARPRGRRHRRLLRHGLRLADRARSACRWPLAVARRARCSARRSASSTATTVVRSRRAQLHHHARHR